jgi:hypothetical protein
MNKTVWLVERILEGRPLWSAWRGRKYLEWVEDAVNADRFDWSVAAHREARLIAAAQRIECYATEHIFFGDALRADLRACVEALEAVNRGESDFSESATARVKVRAALACPGLKR